MNILKSINEREVAEKKKIDHIISSIKEDLEKLEYDCKFTFTPYQQEILNMIINNSLIQFQSPRSYGKVNASRLSEPKLIAIDNKK